MSKQTYIVDSGYYQHESHEEKEITVCDGMGCDRVDNLTEVSPDRHLCTWCIEEKENWMPYIKKVHTVVVRQLMNQLYQTIKP